MPPMFRNLLVSPGEVQEAQGSVLGRASDDLSARDFIRRYKVSKSIFEIICNTIREDIGPAPRPPTSCTRRGRGRPRKILAEHKVRVT